MLPELDVVLLRLHAPQIVRSDGREDHQGQENSRKDAPHERAKGGLAEGLRRGNHGGVFGGHIGVGEVEVAQVPGAAAELRVVLRRGRLLVEYAVWTVAIGRIPAS